MHDFRNIPSHILMISRLQPAHIQDHIQHLRAARHRFNGFGDFGLRRVTAQGKPDGDADANRRARDSGHRVIHITRRDENHGEAMLLRFPAQSQDIELRRLRPQHRMVYKFRQIPFRHYRLIKTWLVCFVYLVDLVYLVSFVQPNKLDKSDKPNNGLLPLADFFSILHNS
jgi:hypothetical protein